MKIGLVNLCKIEDFSKKKEYQASLEFLRENNIDFVDYFSGRESLIDLLDGFHEALSNKEVELIWFIQGGNNMIRFLDKIDWELVERSQKEYLGLSDFTHFVFRAVSFNKICYYGPGLKNIKSYFPIAEQNEFIIRFLKYKEIEPYDAELIFGKGILSLENEKIVGGHSFISALMLQNTKIDLSSRLLFFEHHSLLSEGLDGAGYFLNAVKLYILHNKPKSIILGHSIILDKDGTALAVGSINQYFTKNLIDLDLPIYYIDHFKKIIKFS